MPSIEHKNLWGLFDGTSQGQASFYKTGLVAFLNSSHYFKLNYTTGEGSNN